ncbi:hypothetical protein PRIPAC_71532 [Pristionchus pacificus]|uniref:Uncharacterized protein n=1 Tax=Pristionchus pacificus TaxID=54126 RepID=A0A2A6C8G7_PRIPA|nr:hypothetical protein PRIPAC_71532 [Pristionchus pacificus]|eukprot:PDM74321.1 hypothetical protein PRIPAC_41677 [Pristionchus pacificus]
MPGIVISSNRMFSNQHLSDYDVFSYSVIIGNYRRKINDGSKSSRSPIAGAATRSVDRGEFNARVVVTNRPNDEESAYKFRKREVDHYREDIESEEHGHVVLCTIGAKLISSLDYSDSHRHHDHAAAGDLVHQAGVDEGDGLEEEVRGCVDNNNEGDEGEGDLNGNQVIIDKRIAVGEYSKSDSIKVAIGNCFKTDFESHFD